MEQLTLPFFYLSMSRNVIFANPPPQHQCQ
nr:MAG TPA: hypothetical protein [Caudoviricetes sp.]